MTWQQRAINEAMTWLGTPHHNGARVKGAGVDCGQILIAAYESAGVLRPGECEPGEYPGDWALHRSEEMYLGWIERFCDQVEGAPQPGDIALFQFGRCISHAAIVIEWPKLIHAYINLGVIVSDASESLLCDAKGESRLRGIYRPRARG